jgi:hypothetical protein
MKHIQGGSNMTGTDLCVLSIVSVPVIFEPPCKMETILEKKNVHTEELRKL